MPKSDLKPGIEVHFHFTLVLLSLYQYRAVTSKCDCKEISLQLCCSLTVLLDTHPGRYHGEIIKWHFQVRDVEVFVGF